MYLNITDHALMRFAQRFENENILNENAFKLWKQENEEKKEKYKKRINDILWKIILSQV